MDDSTTSKTKRLAVLIDADNANPKLVEALFREISKYGTANVKRVYGDWTTSQLGGWKGKLHKFSILPIQQFRYTVGKNSTDSALIIDAMDLLYTQNFDGFCIVSSDSDYTRLASRIREAGLVVYGFGERKTPEAFVEACDKFIFTEILNRHDTTLPGTTDSAASTEESAKVNRKLQQLLRDAYEAIADEDGWAHLGPFGSQLNKLSPSFDSRNYGFSKLSGLVKSTHLFDIKTAHNHFVIKLK
ncbi:Maebl [filamentous cyanobacterium CCP5]|nr:Maebl [filamentous cyanobacterium CCP5]